MSYIYTERNILKEPHNYMYSSYSGVEFLEQYIKNRVDNIQEYLKNEDKIDEENAVKLDFILNYLNRILDFDQIRQLAISEKSDFHKLQLIDLPADKNPVNINTDNTDETENSTTINTRTVIIDLIGSFFAQELNATEEEKLNKFVQRFEVSKKLYQSYNLEFRSGSGSFEEIQTYWLFAVLLGLYHVKTKKLNYLNAFLKVSDLLCSISANIVLKEVPKNGMVLLLALELACTTSLAKSKGVPVDTK
jgi:hypothetical protein